MLHSNLIYKFKCNICYDIYYAKVKPHVKVRTCEHLGITPKLLHIFINFVSFNLIL